MSRYGLFRARPHRWTRWVSATTLAVATSTALLSQAPVTASSGLVGWSGSITRTTSTDVETDNMSISVSGSPSLIGHQGDSGGDTWWWQQRATWTDKYQIQYTFVGKCDPSDPLEDYHDITHSELGQGSGTADVTLTLQQTGGAGPTLSAGPANIQPSFDVNVSDSCGNSSSYSTNA